MRTPPHEAVADIAKLLRLDDEHCIVWGKYNDAQQAMEYTIATRQTGKPIGAFHRITGALSSQSMQIIAADIHTQPGEIAWDRFVVEDLEFDGPPPASTHRWGMPHNRRRLGARQYLTAAVFPRNGPRRGQTLPRLSRRSPLRFALTTAHRINTRLLRCLPTTAWGCLYAVSKVLFDMQLILHSAKISTHLDQVVDVFYVSDVDGNKIEEGTSLYLIRQRLLQAVSG